MARSEVNLMRAQIANLSDRITQLCAEWRLRDLNGNAPDAADAAAQAAAGGDGMAQGDAAILEQQMNKLVLCE